MDVAGYWEHRWGRPAAPITLEFLPSAAAGLSFVETTRSGLVATAERWGSRSIGYASLPLPVVREDSAKAGAGAAPPASPYSGLFSRGVDRMAK